jgi:hypothetical protein
MMDWRCRCSAVANRLHCTSITTAQRKKPRIPSRLESARQCHVKRRMRARRHSSRHTRAISPNKMSGSAVNEHRCKKPAWHKAFLLSEMRSSGASGAHLLWRFSRSTSAHPHHVIGRFTLLKKTGEDARSNAAPASESNFTRESVEVIRSSGGGATVFVGSSAITYNVNRAARRPGQQAVSARTRGARARIA